MGSRVRRFGHHMKSKRTSLNIVAAAVTLATASYIALSPSLARTLVFRPEAAFQNQPSPLLLLVSIQKQRVRVFNDAGEIASSRISSGRPGLDTPTGVFSILEKSEYHESNIYEGAPMPFMQRITWSGVAMHAGVVPGYRASHGCIRLPASFAKSLFAITKVGGRVVVTPDEIEPIAFNHPNLFRPLPAETPQVAGSGSGDTKVAANDQNQSLMTELPRFLGLTPALAEAARDPTAFTPPKPRSRAEAERALTDKINRLQIALKTAEAQKIATSTKAKQALRDAELATTQLNSIKTVMDPIRANAAAAERRLAEAKREFEAFMSGSPPPALKSGTKVGARPDATPEDQEADLEDAILDLTIEADIARAEVARREMDFATVQAQFSAADSARSAALDDVRDVLSQLRSQQAGLIDANKEVVRRAKPLSVFVSLKTERIYVRQGMEPLLEAPIVVAANAGRIGTHVLTAMKYGANPNEFDWRLVSAQIPASTQLDGDDRKSKKRTASLPGTPQNSIRMARVALDAIKIPQDILDTISELARPGASFIISDRELPASENGLGTEFVVLTR